MITSVQARSDDRLDEDGGKGDSHCRTDLIFAFLLVHDLGYLSSLYQ